MTHPASTVIGNDTDDIDGSGNSSAIGFLRAILAALGGSLGGANKSVNITTATTTAAIKTGAGVVKRLNINTGGAGSTVVLYDSLTGSGTKLGTFSTAAQNSIALDMPFTTGLSAVTANGSAADITVVYQ